MGLGLAYRTFRLQAGDEVLTTEHDHYSTHESLRLRARADGVTVRKVRLYPPRTPELATVDGVVGALRRAITPRTRLDRDHVGAFQLRREAAGAIDRGRDRGRRTRVAHPISGSR